MTWMASWAGGFPLAMVQANGAQVTDVDGFDYVDFALGDTGAMAGHSPEPVVSAIRKRVETLGGITALLPNEDAEWVASELSQRFGVDQWSFALSATDANPLGAPTRSPCHRKIQDPRVLILLPRQRRRDLRDQRTYRYHRVASWQRGASS